MRLPVKSGLTVRAPPLPPPTVTRFAPSPTGGLHLGHAWSAILAHDRARRDGGAFRVRIEDIDGTRSRPEHVAGIVADLCWLGLAWDGPVLFQSRRLDAYAAALARLRALGLLYPCFCTRAEIAAALSAPHGPEPVYPGTCRRLGEFERAARIAGGAPHAWRLDAAKALATATAPTVSPRAIRAASFPGEGEGPGEGAETGAGAGNGPLTWHDEIAGTIVADPLSHGDVVLARKDAPASYHLAVSVDDAWQGITHVVRGADLFAATHVHRLLQALLELPTPVYRHHPLLTGADGTRLAKRSGAPTLESLRLAGGDGALLADRLRAGVLPIGFAGASP